MTKASLLASVVAALVLGAQDAHGFAGGAIGRTFSKQHVVLAQRAASAPASSQLPSRSSGLRMSVGDQLKDAVNDVVGGVGADASGGYFKKAKNWWAESIPAADGLGPGMSGISQESKPIQVRERGGVACCDVADLGFITDSL